MNPVALLARAGGTALKGVFAGLLIFRHGRPIHRNGVLLEGTLTHTRVFSGEEWLDSSGEEPVIGRISRSVGLPDSVPDVIGFALRIGETDVLLSSTGQGVPGRFLLHPRKSLVNGSFTTLMPFRGAGGPLILAARREGAGPDFTRLSGLRAHRSELQWGLYYSRLRGPWTRFATLRLRVASEQRGNPRFDPVGRPPAGLETYQWTRTLRRPSYALAQNTGSTVTLRGEPH